MPPIYEYIDQGICLLYLTNYLIIIYISQNRCQYFISNDSITEIFIIFPVLLFPYACEYYGILFKAVSRVLRIFKINIFLMKSSDGDETNVSQLTYNIIADLVLKSFVTAALYMVIENQDTNPLNNNNGNDYLEYNYHTSFYVTVITMTTIGYGDRFPKTLLGQVFIACAILYIICYKLPVDTGELMRLMNLTSKFERVDYAAKDEVPHIVITGNVIP